MEIVLETMAKIFDEAVVYQTSFKDHDVKGIKMAHRSRTKLIDPEKRKRLIRQWEHAKEDMSLRAFAMAHGMASETFKKLIEMESK